MSLNNVQNNTVGIKIENSSNNRITYNKVEVSRGYGIQVEYSISNLISSNRIELNYIGLQLYQSQQIYLRENMFINNFEGLTIINTNYSVVKYSNLISNSWTGIKLMNSHENRLIGNNVSFNLIGVSLQLSNQNIVFHNNFINNTKNAEVSEAINNRWDNGYPSGGNYWSDYNGTDLYSGLHQNLTGSDGIGDFPYLINISNI